MKKFFEEPEMEIVAFTVEDIITESNGEGEWDDELPVFP